MSDNKPLQARRKPLQKRSLERIEKILENTAILLEQLGMDGLTTIKIAEATGISVGSLYHYFPNKQAILHALGESWLEKISSSLDGLKDLPLDDLSIEEFVDRVLEAQLSVYIGQKGLLHLVQALFSIPELQVLDRKHDDLVMQQMMHMLSGMGATGLQDDELERLARAYHEMTHALMLTMALQTPARAKNTLKDTKRAAVALLQPYLS